MIRYFYISKEIFPHSGNSGKFFQVGEHSPVLEIHFSISENIFPYSKEIFPNLENIFPYWKEIFPIFRGDFLHLPATVIFASECSMCSHYPTLVFRKKWSNNRNSAYYRRDKLKTQILKLTASCFF